MVLNVAFERRNPILFNLIKYSLTNRQQDASLILLLIFSFPFLLSIEHFAQIAGFSPLLNVKQLVIHSRLEIVANFIHLDPR